MELGEGGTGFFPLRKVNKMYEKAPNRKTFVARRSISLGRAVQERSQCGETCKWHRKYPPDFVQRRVHLTEPSGS